MFFSNIGLDGFGSFRPWVVSDTSRFGRGSFRLGHFGLGRFASGRFGRGSFRPDYKVGRFGLFWWVVSARYTQTPSPLFTI